MENVNKCLDDVISCIKESTEYQTCLFIQEKMKENEELFSLIQGVKKLQKQYIRSNYNLKIKEQLDQFNQRLEEVPIYVVYLQNLEIVNQKIDYIREELNDYFYQLFN